jgi:glycosyltransferase involved in cell wall biosynthesis
MIFLEFAQSELVSIFTGKSIISTIDAPVDIVKESGAGISCPAEDPQALSQAIHAIKSLNPAEREVMEKRGRKWVIKNRDNGCWPGSFWKR